MGFGRCIRKGFFYNLSKNINRIFCACKKRRHNNIKVMLIYRNMKNVGILLPVQGTVALPFLPEKNQCQSGWIFLKKLHKSIRLMMGMEMQIPKGALLQQNTRI